MGTRRTWLSAGIATVCALAAVGCGSSSSSSTAGGTSAAGASTTAAATTAATTAASTGTGSSTGTATTGSASPASLVPSAIKSKGSITVAADASYAPDEFIGPDGKTVIGMDADLAAAIGNVLGLKVSVVNVTFDNIIPGMAAGKYELGMSSFTDTKAREKTVDFVDYANVGESFYTKAQGGTNIGSIADICGLTVSVESGTTEQADATTQGKKCTAAGKKPVSVKVFQTQTLANLAVSSGRAQLGFADTPVAAYQVKQSHGVFKLVGAEYAPAPYGIAIAKPTGLTNAVKAALLDLINNGTYGKIFKKWGVSGIAIPASQVKVNGATS
jgi:polar amino acid transport system substrate-binding protein